MARQLVVLNDHAPSRHLEAMLAMLVCRRGRGDPAAAQREVDQLELAAQEQGRTLPLHHLRERYELSGKELELLLEAVRCSLHPEGTEGVLTVDHLLAITTKDQDQLLLSGLLDPRSTLIRHQLLVPKPEAPATHRPSGVAQFSVPRWVVTFLQGHLDVGRSLDPFARLVLPGDPGHEMPWSSTSQSRAAEVLIDGWMQGPRRAPLVLNIVGERGSGKSALTLMLARRALRPLVEVEVSSVVHLDPLISARVIRELYAMAFLFDAWIVLDGAQALTADVPSTQSLCRCLEQVATLSFLLSTRPLEESTGLAARTTRQVVLRHPDEEERPGIWVTMLDRKGAGVIDRATLSVLAARFELSPAQIGNISQEMGIVAPAKPDGSSSLTREAIEEAAIGQLRGDPGSLARLRRTPLKLRDLVLPREEMARVREVLDAARNHGDLLHRWGFHERMPYGTGIVCLFSGEPGTGKTLCAQILAADLGYDLYQVSLPQVLSKWVGETEKSIARLFHEAKACRAMLLFDEADSLLGARTEVHNASDKFANTATNLLMQEIEAFEGVVILTTNLEANLDSAAARRILFRLRFPFPDAEARARLWRLLLPKQAAKTKDINFQELGEAFELSGGHIKNAVIRAAYDALQRKVKINMKCLAQAAIRECQAIGRLIREDYLELD